MEISEKISVAILAGGQSRRFGSKKESALFEGKTLLQHALETAREITARVFLISNDPTDLNGQNLPVFSDVFKEKGPLAGIHSALVHSQTEWVAIMPVDMPLLTAGVYRLLLQFLTNEQPVVAESEKGLEPLVSVWNRAQSALVERRLEKQALSIYRCVEALDGKKVPVHLYFDAYKPELFANINYPDDLEQLLKR
jgi:molybdopterin-guanine dinucleotide biosynthesis protein A